MSNYNSAKSGNWLAIGSNEWTISRRSDTTIAAFNVYSNGAVSGDGLVYHGSYVVRPSFYLASSVTYASGDGSSSNMFRIQ